MKRFRIKSGDLNWTGEAPGWQEAFRKAIDEQEPDGLGVLFSVQEIGAKTFYPKFYADTVTHLNDMGLLGKK